jgi:DNA-binding HxlR family transcriptional regulator
MDAKLTLLDKYFKFSDEFVKSAPMTRRGYDQYCGLARALDLVGERWTLLIVRELLLGPKRYSDLRGALPGIATNLLATRLAYLEEVGVIARRRLPPPAPATVYELTDHGRALEDAVIALGRWGGLSLGAPAPDEEFRASSFVIGMRATFRPAEASGVDATYEFRIDDEVFHFRVRDGEARAAAGSADSADLVLATDARSFLGLLAGQLAPGDGSLELTGRRSELARVVAMFGFPADAASGVPA